MERKKVVITSSYIPGIYPPGRDDVQVDLLAPGFLKASVDADPELRSKYDVEILYARTDADQRDVASQILSKRPDIVAYSTYLWNYSQMEKNSAIVRERSPNTKIVVGGPQVSYASEDIMRENPQIDTIVRGSGELRFKEMLRRGLNPEPLAQIPDISYRHNGQIANTKGHVEEDLSQVPSPYKLGAINLNDGKKHTVFLETFRGCPFKCGYCIWGGPETRIHKFPTDQLMGDIDEIYNNPNVEYVVITDANLFYTPRDHWKSVLDRIASSSRKVPTVSTLDIRVLNEEMVRGLSETNLAFNQFHFGLQSTNQNALAITNRKCKDEVWTKGMEMIRRVSPSSDISLDIIYGLPGDNYEGFKQTVDFSLGLKPSKLYLFPLLVLPGTPFWEKKDELEFKISGKPDYMVKSNRDYSAEDMRKSVDFAMWFQTLQRFPAILDGIISSNGSARRIDKVDQFIEGMRQKIDPIKNLEFDFTGESNNKVRREMMNEISKSGNCLRAYETALEVLEAHSPDDADEVKLGRDYYKKIVESKDKNGLVDAQFSKKHGEKALSRLKCNWIVAGQNINTEDAILTN